MNMVVLLLFKTSYSSRVCTPLQKNMSVNRLKVKVLVYYNYIVIYYNYIIVTLPTTLPCWNS